MGLAVLPAPSHPSGHCCGLLTLCIVALGAGVEPAATLEKKSSKTKIADYRPSPS